MTATAYSPWGKQPLAANDNAPLIGLTGKRNVGKSTVAAFLESRYGFARRHAFEAGKQAAKTWFDSMDLYGWRMVYGDLKDVPCADLPGGNPPRYFLERFGEFMGVQMGVDWTLAMEIAAARRRWPKAPIVVESVVYEAAWFKAAGGRIWRLERPGHEGPAGIESDAAQAGILPDLTLSATAVDDLLSQVGRVTDQMVGGR
jgi:hypothetical protein